MVFNIQTINSDENLCENLSWDFIKNVIFFYEILHAETMLCPYAPMKIYGENSAEKLTWVHM